MKEEMDVTNRITVTPDEYGYIDTPSYDKIVETFGITLASAQQNDYQGDSLYLLENEGRFGFLKFGWGSCSGCDALEAAQSQKDVDDLQDDLERGINWFDTREEAMKYIESKVLEDSWLDERLIADFRAAVASR